ncbi:T. brucei spp.-specific protein [Trypanosoma brucei gambiense DAL972]|uniref:T. brucei spp.-specific protein n=1 Tax=Trypanosoma brucei gambiense (strain MHOM/CI/86/DAL972) TaxID=679716 RepID=C9ZSV2_TRYB9|nr:T. brucei spp.-specific protein [Trypanosoma brucei gambiense DAL972]CBH12487.1 T. brucei spp.-specific protein [Trypanosoma brucei gambiense DAL972]|eukprot:XP_011774767.1 T. brucei spp.-specific protein [Trypanosoma brucei gambiense DAL972]
MRLTATHLLLFIHATFLFHYCAVVYSSCISPHIFYLSYVFLFFFFRPCFSSFFPCFKSFLKKKLLLLLLFPLTLFSPLFLTNATAKKTTIITRATTIIIIITPQIHEVFKYQNAINIVGKVQNPLTKENKKSPLRINLNMQMYTYIIAFLFFLILFIHSSSSPPFFPSVVQHIKQKQKKQKKTKNKNKTEIKVAVESANVKLSKLYYNGYESKIK